MIARVRETGIVARIGHPHVRHGRVISFETPDLKSFRINVLKNVSMWALAECYASFPDDGVDTTWFPRYGTSSVMCKAAFKTRELTLVPFTTVVKVVESKTSRCDKNEMYIGKIGGHHMKVELSKAKWTVDDNLESAHDHPSKRIHTYTVTHI